MTEYRLGTAIAQILPFHKIKKERKQKELIQS
jgi:hypothetical protein